MESKMVECMASQMWSPKLPQGLDMEISHHPVTMKRVVNLVIAIERLRAGGAEPVPRGTEFRDEHLLSIMLESIVEEQIVYECSATPPDEFTKISEHLFSITNTDKKNLIAVENSMELHAIMLQAGSDNRKVTLNMSTYIHPSPPVQAKPVVLGIKDTNFYLSCHKINDEPTLHLEVVEDKSHLSVISADSEWMRFLFYKQDIPVNVSTLMSARFHGWYISTSDQDNKPVIMSKQSTEYCQDFNMFLQH